MIQEKQSVLNRPDVISHQLEAAYVENKSNTDPLSLLLPEIKTVFELEDDFNLSDLKELLNADDTHPLVQKVKAFVESKTKPQESESVKTWWNTETPTTAKGEKIYIYSTGIKTLPMLEASKNPLAERDIQETGKGMNTDIQIFEAQVKAGKMTQAEFNTFKKENKLPKRYLTTMGDIQARLYAGAYSKKVYFVEYVENEKGTTSAVFLYWSSDDRGWYVYRCEVPDWWYGCVSVFLSNKS